MEHMYMSMLYMYTRFMMSVRVCVYSCDVQRKTKFYSRSPATRHASADPSDATFGAYGQGRLADRSTSHGNVSNGRSWWSSNCALALPITTRSIWQMAWRLQFVMAVEKETLPRRAAGSGARAAETAASYALMRSWRPRP